MAAAKPGSFLSAWDSTSVFVMASFFFLARMFARIMVTIRAHTADETADQSTQDQAVCGLYFFDDEDNGDYQTKQRADGIKIVSHCNFSYYYFISWP